MQPLCKLAYVAGLLLLCLTCAAGQRTRYWWAGVGGSTGADQGLGMAIRGDRRFIAGILADTSGNNDLPDVVFGDYQMSNVVKSPFVAQVTGRDSVLWSLKPRQCHFDEVLQAQSCARYDDVFLGKELQIAPGAVFVGDDNVAVVIGQFQGVQRTYHIKKTNGDWLLTLSLMPTRIRKLGEANTEANPSYQTVSPTFTVLDAISCGNMMYMMAYLQGSIRFGLDKNGVMEKTYTVDGNVFSMVGDSSKYDKDENIENKITYRRGFLLVAVDLLDGNLKFITPIWSQGPANDMSQYLSNLRLAASCSGDGGRDGQLFITADIRRRVVFGAPVVNPMADRKPVLVRFPNSTNTVDPRRQAGETGDYVFTKIMVELSARESSFRQAGTKQLSVAITEPRTSTKTLGNWQAVVADRATDQRGLFVAGTWSAPSYLGVCNDTIPLTTQTTPERIDGTDAFVALLDPTTGACKWVGVFKGFDDQPDVQDMAVKDGKLYLLLRFYNQIQVSADTYAIAATTSDSAAVGESYAVVIMDAKRGTYDNHAVIVGTTGMTILEMDVNGDRVYIMGQTRDTVNLMYADGRQGVSVSPRAGATNIFWATYAPSLPKSLGSEMDDDSDEKRRRDGIIAGVLVGLGLPLIVLIALAIWYMRKKNINPMKYLARPPKLGQPAHKGAEMAQPPTNNHTVTVTTTPYNPHGDAPSAPMPQPNPPTVYYAPPPYINGQQPQPPPYVQQAPVPPPPYPQQQ